MLSRHEDVVQMVGYWMIRSEHSDALARLTIALVDSGGLLLACVERNSMAILGESLFGQPSYELVRCIVNRLAPADKTLIRPVIQHVGLLGVLKSGQMSRTQHEHAFMPKRSLVLVLSL